ncbi:MAG: condensation domain-containing protein [Bryobacteraceae bacterium]
MNPDILREISTDLNDPEQILRAIEASRPEQEPCLSEGTPARVLEEEALVEIWESVLHRDRIGVHDNFFDAGGTSLSAVQVLSRVSAIFLVDLPLRLIFERPTISGLAAAIYETRPGESSRSVFPALVAQETVGARPASFAQEALWLAAELDPASPAYGIAGALRLKGDVDVAAVEWAFNRVVKRHDSLRTRFDMVSGELIQIAEPIWQFRLDEEDVRGAGESEWRRRAGEDAGKAFDLRQLPLLRVRLFRTGFQEWVLSMVLHHIAADGWSFGVLESELGALYQERTCGIAADLPKLKIQYADYAQWQRDCFRRGLWDRQLTWWTERLSHGASKLNLPRASTDALVRSGQVQLDLGSELTIGVKAAARRLACTLHMFLVAALACVLYRIGGQDEITIGTPVAGRSQAATEGLIGLFANILVVHVRLDGDPTFAELIRRVKEELLACHERQDVPLEVLMKKVRASAGEGGVPFEILFALQNAPMARFQPDGLEVSREGVRTGAPRLPLSIWAADSGGGIVFDSEFDRQIYDASLVERILTTLRDLLKAVATSESLRILDIPLDDGDGAFRTVLTDGDRASQFRF